MSASEITPEMEGMSFYVTGGTLRRDAPSYVVRRADDELYGSLMSGRFCYVLTPRQMGKSSLMIRTAAQLREAGAAVAVLDLTAIGQNLKPDQWYTGLLNQIGQQLDLEDEFLDFWDRHPQLGPLQRWMRAIREVMLERFSGRVVIFVDEIDATRSLPFSTDEFFAGLREFYNRRTEDGELERLTFCLLGVATPSDLIRDTRTTPFNIGQRIELTDFTADAAAPLVAGLGRPERVGRKLLERILHWTGGHPYLTQRLCQAVAADAGVSGRAGVDRLCDALFLSARARELDDNLLFVRERMLRSEADLAALLDLYARVLARKPVPDDDTDPLVGVLRLTGVTRAEQGRLTVRNRIYERVFDRSWVTASMPDAELRRQRAAYRRGMLRATGAATAVLVVLGVLSLAAIQGRLQAVEQRRVAESERAKAEQERGRAEAESRRASDFAGKLQLALAEAEKQKEIAQEQGSEAERQGQVNQRLLYDAQMNLAQRAWETNNIARVLDLLGKQQEELRGFEWHYLWRLCHSDLATLPLPSGPGVMAVSRDGTLAAAAEQELQVRVWDVLSGHEKARLSKNAAGIKALAFSADNRHLATGGEDGAVRLWDVSSGKELFATQVNDPVTVIAFSPHGRLLAVGSQDNSVLLGTVQKGFVPLGQQNDEGHTDEITSLAFSPDGKQLATGSRDNTAILWDVADRKRLRLLSGHTQGVNAITFSPNGRLVATASQDMTARVWEVEGGSELKHRKHDGAVTALTFSSDGNRLATSGSDYTIKVWDVEDEQPPLTRKGHTGTIVALAFSGGGNQLVSAGSDRTVKRWDLTAEDQERLKGRHTGQIKAVAISADGRRLATAGAENAARLWDTAGGKELRPLRGGERNDAVNAVAFSRDGRWLITGGDDAVLRFWDPVTGQLRDSKVLSGQINALAFSPNSRLLAAVTNEGAVILSEMSRKHDSVPLGDEGMGVVCVAFAPGGSQLATGDEEGIVRVWNVATRRELFKLVAHKTAITSLAFSPDDGRLVTASLDGTAKLWDVVARRPMAIFGEGVVEMTATAFSPDGKRIVTGGADGAVRLWDVMTQQEVFTFKEHTGRIQAVAFSPDGKSLATGSSDTTWKLFRAIGEKEILAHTR